MCDDKFASVAGKWRFAVYLATVGGGVWHVLAAAGVTLWGMGAEFQFSAAPFLVVNGSLGGAFLTLGLWATPRTAALWELVDVVSLGRAEPYWLGAAAYQRVCLRYAATVSKSQ